MHVKRPMLLLRALALCSRREHRPYAPAATSKPDDDIELKQRSDWHLLCVFRPFFDRFPSLKQRSDWHGRKMVEKCKASANLNAALSSGNARKTVEKRKASVNLNAAFGANKIPPNITQIFRTSQPQLCFLDEGDVNGDGRR